MVKLPPDVRDRAAQRAQSTWLMRPSGGWRAVVDAVAEVLAAEQPKSDDQLAALEAEFPEQAPMLRQAMKDAPAVILRLQARVDELEGALAEDDKLLRFAVDRGLLSQHVDDLIDDRDALKARVDLLTTALTGLCDVYHVRPLNELLDGEETISEADGPKFAAWANARAVLSATPTAQKED